MLVIFYAFWIFIFGILNPNEINAPQKTNQKVNYLNSLKSISYPLILIFIVLGSILFGIATPTESAALGAVGSTLIALLSKRLDLKILFEVADNSVRITSMVFFILIGASVFSLVLRGYGGDIMVEEFLSSIPGGPAYSLLIVMLTIFVLGFFLDFLQIIFVIVPIVGPSLISMGFDPIWLGILIAINLQTSFLTPPFGFALFYFRGIAPKEIGTKDIYIGVIPFIILQVVVLFLIYKFPIVVTYLPSIIS